MLQLNLHDVFKATKNAIKWENLINNVIGKTYLYKLGDFGAKNNVESDQLLKSSINSSCFTYSRSKRAKSS